MSIQVYCGDGTAPVVSPAPSGLWPQLHTRETGLHILGGSAATGKTALMVRWVVDYLHMTDEHVVLFDGWQDNSISNRLGQCVQETCGRRSQQANERLTIINANSIEQVNERMKGRRAMIVVDGIEGLIKSDASRGVELKKAMETIRRLTTLNERPAIVTTSLKQNMTSAQPEMSPSIAMVADTVTTIERPGSSGNNIIKLAKSWNESPGAKIGVKITQGGYVEW